VLSSGEARALLAGVDVSRMAAELLVPSQVRYWSTQIGDQENLPCAVPPGPTA
jgi:hypothetical protein